MQISKIGLVRVFDEKFEQLCYACRVGDIENVDKLIGAGVTLNGVDAFDNSPLFLASLCGHEEIVKLLLKRGSVCDRDRHEGARCIYGALTDSIRKTLLAYDISKAVDLSQPFAMHISSLIRDESSMYQDILVKMNHPNVNVLKLHRFILASRSPYFYDKLTRIWNNKKEIDMINTKTNEEFELLMKFIYLIPILHMVQPWQIKRLAAISNKFGFNELNEFLKKLQHTTDPKAKSSLMMEYQYKFTEKSRLDLETFVERDILKNKISYKNTSSFSDYGDQLKSLITSSPFCDTFVHFISCGDGKNYIYPAHRAILVRSDYFKLLLSSPFSESTGTLVDSLGESEDVSYTVLEIPGTRPEIVETILRYLYYDDTNISVDHALEILLAADALLLDRLKSIAAVSITTNEATFLQKYSIFYLLNVAWGTQVERLEHFVARVIAYNLDKYASDKDLYLAIENSASRIEVRQAADTIELVDDINYYLLEKHHLQFVEEDDYEFDYDEMTEEERLNDPYTKDRKIISHILSELGLSAFVPDTGRMS